MKHIKKLDKINTNANVFLPSSKSYLNRALITASIRSYTTELTDVIDICSDVNDLIQILRQLGVKIDIEGDRCGSKIIKVFGNNGNFIKPVNGIM